MGVPPGVEHCGTQTGYWFALHVEKEGVNGQQMRGGIIKR
jgi:hypothetical protein